MKNSAKHVVVLAIGALCASVAAKAYASGLDTPVKKQVYDMNIQSICMGARIVCGVEELKGKDSIHGKGLSKESFYDGTYRDLLVELIKRNPKYDWVERDGVVNVFPKPKYRKGRSPLENKLKKVEFADAWTNIAAWDLLEIAGIPRVNGMEAYLSGSGKTTVSLRDVTVREALNGIVKSDGKAMWIFRPVERGEYIIYVFGWSRSTLFK